ncbi:bifunctional copper resistance protein CopD/cytochrome c oxidase assembly protein [Cryobacterium sp. 1639]|uniref:cytochrome c oxidase assembly protein n=1 Tax=Cryobacterium inferilacus TaxID=2866629 RepID=UPI001C733DEA|nr:cytochrome c oxidase assembly protein [Cryobacterium sp. 1639]MBX0301409.1 bifunctional copper resistance protein CopD/cytochrome c oxidase assembly protein [Cryobacterium sp. 1639]
MVRTATRVTRRQSIAWIFAPALLLAFALITVVGATLLTLPTQPELLIAEGPVVSYGIPLAKVLMNLSSAGTLGALVLACFALTPVSSLYGRTLDIAAGCAGAWAVTSAAGAVFTFMSLAGPVSSPGIFIQAFMLFLTDIGLGQAWLATMLLSAGITVLCFAVRGVTAIGAVTALAGAAFVPLALQGHAAGAGGHTAATTAIWLHTIGAATWIGGLVLIAVLHRKTDRKTLVITLRRYSSIALICFVIVAVSGVVSAALRVEQLSQLVSTTYGLLLVVKVLALIALGAVGVGHRRLLLKRLADISRVRWEGLFWRLVGAEVLLMGLASGVAVVLARTPPPILDKIAVTAAERLTGQPLPAPLSWQTVVSSWTVDPVWLLAAGFGIFLYVAGIHRLRARGESWPALRTLSWVTGLGVLLYTTNGAPNTYGSYLVSAHVLGDLSLALVVPVLLVLGGPVALGLRAIVARGDGSRGGREWILLFQRSSVLRVLLNPIVAGVLLGGSFFAFYYTPLFAWAIENPVGHQWMIAHFLIVGTLFIRALAGVDPNSPRAALRLVVALAGVTSAVALLGLSFIGAAEPLLPDWYGVISVEWGTDPLAEQHLAGRVVLAMGIPAVLIAGLASIRLVRSNVR